ncbi:MAG: hypothetical protein ACYC5X_12540 [Syntrophales bacterium]
MNKEEISKNLELYSNSIIAFIAVQSLVFCYQAGTDNFNNRLTDSILLSSILGVIFLVAYTLALKAQYHVYKKLEELNGENSEILKFTLKGKLIVIGIFGFLHMVVIIFMIIHSISKQYI